MQATFLGFDGGFPRNPVSYGGVSKSLICYLFLRHGVTHCPSPVCCAVAMPPGRRALRPTPSCSAELSEFQLKLLNDLKLVDEGLLEQRRPFLSMASAYAAAIAAEPQRVFKEMCQLGVTLFGDAEQVAKAWTRDAFKAEDSKVVGIRDTCIAQWRFDELSMWRGVPDNPRVLKLARSIISSRFRKDSVVASRTLDMSKCADAKDLSVWIDLQSGLCECVRACMSQCVSE